ncbi:MAG: lipid-A-disaccharide synthase-related protein [Cyanobacteria bacterium]|nr:lipid-A-disaccharide synthase-related protein [Cyanobacteriota bacterium]MDW8202426.1 lipid-A-disaccharide synthase-related protein [Cyanobacteriota bacterium SKYGB_h_bin112]
MQKLLCLSNGHGEDEIACRIATALQQQPNPPELAGLPIVGVGHAYRQAGITIVGPVQTMPSGGFVNQDGRQLVRDMQAGLVQLTLAQLRAVKAWAAVGGFILAVGDIVPLVLAWLSGAPYALVATAKSDYHLRDEETGIHPNLPWFERLEYCLGGVYLPWERWLMNRPNCKAVYPRDRLTTTTLQRYSIPAIDLGNPMMDGFDAASADTSAPPNCLTLLLLPGSRIPEAYANWRQILQAVQGVIDTAPDRALRCLAAIAPSLSLAELATTLVTMNWQANQGSSTEFHHTLNPNIHLELSTAFTVCAQQADVAIAMTGTATEQFVGLGKPAITMPGRGPQFTLAFAQAQNRLLGCSVTLAPNPEAVAPALQRLLSNADGLHAIAQNGYLRMGAPGAAQRIAKHLITLA